MTNHSKQPYVLIKWSKSLSGKGIVYPVYITSTIEATLLKLGILMEQPAGQNSGILEEILLEEKRKFV